MNTARRKGLPSEGGVAKQMHAGLMRDRYLRAHKEMLGKPGNGPSTPEEDLLEDVIKAQASETYKAAFHRWEQIAKDRGCRVVPATAAGSLAIGLGNESPLEVGLSIHHTYGMPFVPGSAIKGLCRAVARQLRDENKLVESQLDACFGTTKQESAFVFWDAWYDPSSVGGKPFHRDVLTVHHPQYYQSHGRSGWPTDFDDPVPVPFLVVKPSARFLFAIEGPKAWHGFMGSLLQWALENAGVGGKTSAGYGRFAVQPAPVIVRPEWVRAWVNYNPSRRALTALELAGKKRKAVADEDTTARILSAHPDEATRRYHKGAEADVSIRSIGNAWHIVDMRKEGAEK